MYFCIQESGTDIEVKVKEKCSCQLYFESAFFINLVLKDRMTLLAFIFSTFTLICCVIDLAAPPNQGYHHHQDQLQMPGQQRIKRLWLSLRVKVL